jgi:hypothetical protein
MASYTEVWSNVMMGTKMTPTTALVIVLSPIVAMASLSLLVSSVMMAIKTMKTSAYPTVNSLIAVRQGCHGMV